MKSERYVNLFFARHGKTPMNGEGILQSHTDTLQSALSPEGRVQAQELRNRLARVSFPHIYSSPYLRALETASLVANQKVDVIPVPALVERSFGLLEGTNHKESMDARHDFLIHQNDQDYNNRYGIETDKSLHNRLIPFLESIAVAHLGMNALFVTHSGVMRYLLHELLGYSYEELKAINITETAHIHIRVNLDNHDKKYEVVSLHGIQKNGIETDTLTT